ncbi:MAG: glycosyltransferase [Terracidiphilus sp.]|jgi:poly(glycerol-phosphate) alpha-glucosyltransferase
MNGGISDAMRNLTIAIARQQRYSPAVFGARDAFTAADEALWDGIPTNTFPVRGPRLFGYAPALADALEASEAEVLHVHGIWTYPSVLAPRWSQGRRPYIVSPHGLLRHWALRNSWWKKRIAAALYEDRHLRGAACLHALNEAEADSFREYGLRNPVCVIPNGTELPQEAVPSKLRKGRSILYLGRFHPSKGLRSLLAAWSAVRGEAEAGGWRLTLAGWDQGRHRTELERLADRLGLRACVTFLGPQFGADKNRCLAEASAFVLPSKSEGLPMSVLEAWSWRLPVLMTRQCNLLEGVEAGAAIQMEPEADSIASALRSLFSLTDSERDAMGQSGRRLVEERFQWPRIAETMTAVYDWLLGRGPRPACVSL